VDINLVFPFLELFLNISLTNFVGLDPKTTKLVKDIFKNSSKNGKTIFMSTHTLSLAEEICGRICIIDNGNLIAIGTLEELRKKSGIDGRLEEIFLKLT